MGILRYLILIVFVMSTSCVVVPKSPVRAKQKINRLKSSIENISRYHGFDSVWFEKRKVYFDLPPVSRTISLDFDINRRVILDSVLVTRDSVVRETFIRDLLELEINYEDSLVTIGISITPDGYDLDYLIKPRKDSVEVQIEKVYIDSGLKYYRQRPFWYIVILFTLLVFYLLYLIVRRSHIK